MFKRFSFQLDQKTIPIKRRKVLTSIIEKASRDEDSVDNDHTPLQYYVLADADGDVSPGVITNILKRNDLKEDAETQLLKSIWITDCIRENRILPTKNYLLSRPKSTKTEEIAKEEKEEKAEDTKLKDSEDFAKTPVKISQNITHNTNETSSSNYRPLSSSTLDKLWEDHEYCPEVSFAIVKNNNVNESSPATQPGGWTRSQRKLIARRYKFACQRNTYRNVDISPNGSPTTSKARKLMKDLTPNSITGFCTQLEKDSSPEEYTLNETSFMIDESQYDLNESDVEEGNINDFIHNKLSELAYQYEQNNEQWRALAARKCANIVKNLKDPLTVEILNSDQIKIGPSSKQKLLELVETHKLSVLDGLASGDQSKIRGET